MTSTVAKCPVHLWSSKRLHFFTSVICGNEGFMEEVVESVAYIEEVTDGLLCHLRLDNNRFVLQKLRDTSMLFQHHWVTTIHLTHDLILVGFRRALSQKDVGNGQHITWDCGGHSVIFNVSLLTKQTTIVKCYFPAGSLVPFILIVNHESPISFKIALVTTLLIMQISSFCISGLVRWHFRE